MRHTARIITAIAIAATASTSVQAQQMSGGHVVGGYVVSDVAIGEGGYQTSPSDGAFNQGVSEGSYNGDGCANGECYDDSCEGGGGGGQCIAKAGERLGYLIKGGEEGPTINKQYAQPDLFYNYYSNGRNQVNAEIYLSPVPVPPFVGNTWYTYQPWMPHNYLYKHSDSYHNHYDYGRGTNRTRISYGVSGRQYAQTFMNFIRLPR